MIRGELDGSVIEQALRELGTQLGAGHPIEVLLVGGAAGLLTDARIGHDPCRR